MASKVRRKKKLKPEVKILELKSDYIKFSVKNIDLAMANAIRRVCIADVPTLAIENVLLEKNDTVLHDEFICHRLGFVPLTTKSADVRLRGMNFRNVNCNCDISCPKCEVQFRIDYTHHPRHKHDTYLLTSRDIKPISNSDIQPVHFSNEEDEAFARRAEREMRPEVEETQTGIRIVTVGRGQTFRATCKAILGTGKQHAKWSPVAQCVFRQEPVVELNQSRLARMSAAAKQEFVNKSPTKVFEFVESTGEVRVRDVWACEFSGECERWGMVDMNFPADDNVVKFGLKEGSFLFEIETNGQMPPEEVLLSAFEVLDGKCNEVLDTDGGGRGGNDADESYGPMYS